MVTLTELVPDNPREYLEKVLDTLRFIGKTDTNFSTIEFYEGPDYILQVIEAGQTVQFYKIQD